MLLLCMYTTCSQMPPPIQQFISNQVHQHPNRCWTSVRIACLKTLSLNYCSVYRRIWLRQPPHHKLHILVQHAARHNIRVVSVCFLTATYSQCVLLSVHHFFDLLVVC